jgi:hypothetical protein
MVPNWVKTWEVGASETFTKDKGCQTISSLSLYFLFKCVQLFYRVLAPLR